MKTEPTFTATVYVGRKNRTTGETYSREQGIAAIQEYVDAVGLCVTVTDTLYVYSGGSEPGFALGLINYPRFPQEPSAIKQHAIAIATALQGEYRQFRVSVVFPDETVMLGDTEVRA